MIVEERGRPAGYALVTLGGGSCGWEAGGRVADVETLSVLPDARGRGIGTRIMMRSRRSSLASASASYASS